MYTRQNQWILHKLKENEVDHPNLSQKIQIPT